MVIYMKKLEELAVTTTTVASLLPKVIQKKVEEARREKLFMLQLFRENRSLVGKPGKSIYIPKVSGAFSWAIVSEGGDIESALSAQTRTFSSVQITPVKMGTWTQITNEAILTAQVDVVDMLVDRATFDLADALDTYLYQTIVGTASASENIAGAGTSTYTLSHSKILKINSVKVGGSATSGYHIDYYDGKIKLAATTSETVTVDYIYSSRTYVYDASTTAKLTYSDFITAKVAIEENKFTPNVAIVTPSLTSYILKDNRFIDKTKYGKEVMLNGEIGKIAGLKIISSHNAYDVLVVLDAPTFGMVVWKVPLEVLTKKEEKTYSVKVYFYQIVGAGVIFDDAIAIVTNTQSNAQDI